MARPLRIEYENAVYHVTARGNERKNIFADGKDREKFLFYLGLVHERYRVIIYAYVLMHNHYHLLIETPEANLSRMMRDLNGHYTIYFNQRHSRAGHLLQGRYKAILIEKDTYLLELSRYIHLNPVRAAILSKPEDYPYSSMLSYLGKKPAPGWLNVNFILEQFGDSFPLNQQNSQNLQNAYKQFVYDGISNGISGFENPLKNAYASTILGSDNFIEKIRGTLSSKGNISEQVPESKRLKYGKELSDIAKVVLEYYNVDREALTRRKAKFNNAKKVFVYLARTYTNSDLKQIRDFFDNTITDVAISKLFSRMQAELASHEGLKGEVKNVERMLFGGDNIYHIKI